MLDILDSSISVPKIAIDVECISTMFLSIKKIHSEQQSMYAVASKVSSAKISTIQNNVLICRVTLFTIKGIIPCIVIDSLVTARRLGASRSSM